VDFLVLPAWYYSLGHPGWLSLVAAHAAGCPYRLKRESCKFESRLKTQGKRKWEGGHLRRETVALD